jgi:hypothetical protein
MLKERERMPSLMMDVRPGERVVFSLGGGLNEAVAVVELAEKQKSGQLVRLRVTALPAVQIEKSHIEVADQAVPSVAR